MSTRTKLLGGAGVSVAAIIAALLLIFTGGHHHKVRHHATCWAKPGVFAKADGRWVPRYTPAGTRHGRGSKPGVCNG